MRFSVVLFFLGIASAPLALAMNPADPSDSPKPEGEPKCGQLLITMPVTRQLELQRTVDSIDQHGVAAASFWLPASLRFNALTLHEMTWVFLHVKTVKSKCELLNSTSAIAFQYGLKPNELKRILALDWIQQEIKQPQVRTLREPYVLQLLWHYGKFEDLEWLVKLDRKLLVKPSDEHLDPMGEPISLPLLSTGQIHWVIERLQVEAWGNTGDLLSLFTVEAQDDQFNDTQGTTDIPPVNYLRYDNIRALAHWIERNSHGSADILAAYVEFLTPPDFEYLIALFLRGGFHRLAFEAYSHLRGQTNQVPTAPTFYQLMAVARTELTAVKLELETAHGVPRERTLGKVTPVLLTVYEDFGTSADLDTLASIRVSSAIPSLDQPAFVLNELNSRIGNAIRAIKQRAAPPGGAIARPKTRI